MGWTLCPPAPVGTKKKTAGLLCFFLTTCVLTHTLILLSPCSNSLSSLTTTSLFLIKYEAMLFFLVPHLTMGNSATHLVVLVYFRGFSSDMVLRPELTAIGADAGT